MTVSAKSSGPVTREPEYNHYGQKIGSKGERTRRALIDKTVDLLESHGLRDVSVADVARAAKTSPATFYVYFRGVPEVVLAALEAASQTSPEIEALIARHGLSWTEHGVTITYSDYSRTKGQCGLSAFNMLPRPSCKSFASNFATWPMIGSFFSTPSSRRYAHARASATQAPVMEAVRVPPSAWTTSQSRTMVFSPRALRSMIARSDRPMSRLISLDMACLLGLLVWQAARGGTSGWVSVVSFALASTEAARRETFGKPLAQHQVIRHKLVDMAQKVAASQAMLEMLAWRLGQGESPVAEICMMKNQATQTMAHCASEAVQIFGGAGFMRGAKVERIYREVKVNAIGGGAEEIMKDLASRQMGI